MKKALSLILFAAAVFSGCQKDFVEAQQEENTSGELTTIVAYLDNNASKLSLVDDVKLYWAKGDKIEVSDNKIFTVDSIDANNPAKAYFTGTAPTTAEKYRAFYPAQSYSSAAGRFVLLGTQNYGVDNKVTNVNYMYAETTDYNEIHFHNVCGLLAIDLKGEGTVSNIRVSADQYMTGTLNGMSISEGGELTYTGWYTATSQAATYVDLGCGKTATLSKDEARRFYIALPEVDYTNLKLAITTDQGTMVVPATKTASVKKNNIYHIPEITVDIKPLEFDAQIAVVKNTATATSLDLTLSITPTDKNVYYIVDVQTPAYTESFEDALALAKGHISNFSSYPLSTLVQAGLAFKGDCAEYKPMYSLTQDADYVAFAYAVDEYYNVSSAIKLSLHTAKGELPEYSAQYSDYLGDWVMGTDIVTVAELENGKTYKVTGISTLTNTLCTIPYVTASFEKGNFVLNEQYTGKRVPVGSYGDCDFYLSGIDPDSEYLPDYPFATEKPSMILFGQFNSGEINVYSSYPALAVTWIILSGDYAGNGNSLNPATIIPSVLKHPETLPEALFGDWKVTDGYTDGEGTPRTGWTWTLSQSGMGVKIDNFDPMFAAAGAADYDAPVLTWDASAKTLTLPYGTSTGYTGYNWYGVVGGYLDDITFDVDLEKGTISLASDAYTVYRSGPYSWYDAPLVFNKVAAVQTSAKTVSTNVNSNSNVEMVARKYDGRSSRIVLDSQKMVKNVRASFVK